jgi:anti-anti-sigma factor
VEVRQISQVTVVGFTCDDLQDDETIREVGEHLYRLVGGVGRPRILVTFSGVRYLSSSMLAKTARVHRKAEAAGGRLALCAMAPEVYRLFQVARLDRMLNIYRDEREALRSFGGPALAAESEPTGGPAPPPEVLRCLSP